MNRPDLLAFDADAHRYTRKDTGREVPSVSRILKAAGLVDTSGAWFTDSARDRGTGFHLAAQYFDEHDLDVDTLTDPTIAGRFRAYERFLIEQQAEILEIESMVYCDRYDYCGTFDRRLRLRRTGRTYTVDFKPHPASWHRLQLAAYARLTGDEDRAALYVREDGTYKWKPYTDSRIEDTARFLRHRLEVGDSWRTA